MFKNRPLQHIGFATNDLEATVRWYTDALGFEVANRATTSDGTPVAFIRNGATVYELYQPEKPLDAEAAKRIDHISYDSDDIERDYAYCTAHGYTITTDGIEAIPEVWENGVRYFKVKGPSGEEVEFCQIL